MSEPTEAQEKEFWGKLGVHSVEKGTPRGFDPPIIIDKYPPIDLNNLFKYAVPKLDIERINLYPATEDRWGCYFDDWYQDHNVAETPALALFWAIWEVIKNE